MSDSIGSDLTPDVIRKVRDGVAECDLALPFHLPRRVLLSKKHFAHLTGVAIGDTVKGWEKGLRNPRPRQKKRIIELAISVQQERRRRQDELRI